MNRPNQFWRSVNVLATAYLQGKLKPYECEACAVGNLIAADLDGASTDTSIEQWPSHSGFGEWPEAKCAMFDRTWDFTGAIRLVDSEPDLLMETCSFDSQLLPVSKYSVTEVRPELATNLSYTTGELLRIEAALLETTEACPSDNELFDGLMAVVDMLFEIHEVEDEDLRAEAKQSFEGDYNTVEAVLS